MITSHSFLNSQSFGDRYDLVRPIGFGTTSVVYEARCRHTGGLVALKFCAPLGSPSREAKSRLREEARMMGLVSHPNIARLVGCEVEGEQPYLALELLTGRRLVDEVRESGPLSATDGIRLVTRLLDVLDHCHGIGGIHGEVSSYNIDVRRDAYGRIVPKLSSLTGDTSRDWRNACPTTYSCLPHEQIAMSITDPFTDVYGLAACLYFALSGHAAFPQSTIDEQIAAKVRGDFRPLSDWARDVPLALSVFIDRALSPRREERFLSARHAHQWLRRALSSSTVAVRPDHGMFPPVRARFATLRMGDEG